MVEPVGVSKKSLLPGGDERTRPAVGVIVAYVTCVFVWGTTWNAVRLCVLPGGFGPYTAAAVRFGFAAAFLSALWVSGVLRARIQSKQAAWWVIGTGVLSVLSMALVYNAQRSISGGLAAILATTSPLMMAVLATVTKTERVSTAAIVGATVSLVGIGIIFGDRLNVSSEQATGIILLLGSVLINSVNGLVLKRYASGENPFMSVALFVGVSLFCFTGLSAGTEHTDWTTVNAISFAAAAYLGVIGSVVAFACYFYLLKRVRLMTISTMVFFPPVIALIVDCFIEHAVHLSSASYAGIAVTILGVIVGVLKPGALQRTIGFSHGNPADLSKVVTDRNLQFDQGSAIPPVHSVEESSVTQPQPVDCISVDCAAPSTTSQ